MGSLTDSQKSIIVGCIFGDGYMRCKNNAHLQVTHSLNQKNLVDWKYHWLKEMVKTSPTYYYNNGRHCYRFFTRSLQALTPIYKQFYKNGVKIIPESVEINALSLAVWFMDDGSKTYNTVYLNTQQFTEDNQQNLRAKLFENWGIRTTLNKDKKYFRIRIRVESIQQFVKLVSPFVIPSMRYKLPL